ncbi:dephospho-CoA kinase [Sabulicella rubraurantiaca]|uniref:dephospho-CoA kinase n=1 Tax=Sabulicella rubraurantiaca TaxID=2811429 RepID=UPI001A96F0C3|nr:dephospho-CoA kinase [Sabulicella rubraurantiaca]
MKVWGLTGGIGMGKSTAARVFRSRRIPVFDADEAVHALQAKGGAAVRPIDRAFPGTVRDGAVDREALRRVVLPDPAALTRLERIVHPLVRRAESRFLARARAHGARAAVLDIPLLFETRKTRKSLLPFDAIFVVSAPAKVQAQRVLRRPGMTKARLEAIRARQTPDAEKRRRATHVIRTGLSHFHTVAQLRRLLRKEGL